MWNIKCENCKKQDKLEAPRGWELFKRLMKGIWYRWILRRKPDTRYKTFPLPRFWCGVCRKYADLVTPLAITDLSQKALVVCHGDVEEKVVSFVYSLVGNPCCVEVFRNKSVDNEAWLDELKAALKKAAQ